MNDLLRLSHCWVIWNYPHHVTLSHSCSNLLEISLRASTPCKWTLCHMKTRRAVFAYLHVSVEQPRECWQPGGVGASTGRLWLPSEPCASTCLPFGLCLPASVPQRKKERKRQAGKPAEFWWVLTRRELGGKTERRRLSATPWDEMVSSSVQWKLCSLCSISVENMVGEQWGRADTMLVFCDWV